MHIEPTTTNVRLDKWLWAARFYKSRSLSSEEIDKGRVRLNGQIAKPSREVKLGDFLELRSGSMVKTVVVRELSGMRGPAVVAALLYRETNESIALRTASEEQRSQTPEPAASLSQGRPTKRDRRDLDHLKNNSAQALWNAG